MVFKNAPGLGYSVSRIIEWTILAGLFCSSLVFFSQHGGGVLGPRSLEINAILVGAMAVLAAFHWAVEPGERYFTPAALLLLPWAAWLALDSSFLSPSPLEASVRMHTWIQAAVLMCVVVVAGRHRHMLLHMLAAVVLGFLPTAMSGVRQFGLQNGWMPGGGEQPSWISGAASGPFLDPAVLAACIMLLLPLCLCVSLMRSFDVKGRITSGAVSAVLIAALFLTSDKASWIASFCCLMALPFITSRRPAISLRNMAFLASGVALIALAVGGGSQKKRDDIAALLRAQDPLPSTLAASAAADAFASGPVFGAGSDAAAISLFDALPPSANPDGADLRSEYRQLYSSHSLMSLILVAALVFTAYLGTRRWLELPFHKVSREEQFRNLPHNIHDKKDSGSRSASSSRAAVSDRHPAPTTKVMLGGLLLGLFCFAAFMSFCSPFQYGQAVFLLTIVCACIVCLSQPEALSAEQGWAGTLAVGAAAFALVCMVTGGMTAGRALDDYEKARFTLQSAGREEVPLQNQLADIHDARRRLTASIGLFDGNPWAKAMLARASADIAALLPSQSADAVKEGLDLVNSAIEEQDHVWVFHAIRARLLTASGADAAAVESAWVKALECGEDAPAAHAGYAEWLAPRPGRYSDAMSHARRALELLPACEKANAVINRLNILGPR
jgi:hypothetical protein